MYSKIMTSLFFTISMISFLTGCSSPFETKMQPAMSQSLSLGSENTQCLSKAPLQVGKYFNGQSNSEEISSMWNCTSKALDLFGKYVRGKNPGMYTPDELRSFLEKYFLGDLKISNDLLDSLMKLKNVVIGGGSNQITVDEIKKTQSIFEDLKRESVKIIGLHPIRPTHYNDKSFDQLDYVATELVASSNRISAY